MKDGENFPRWTESIFMVFDMTKRKRISIQSVVTYTCKYGFMVVGDATRTCGEDKQWSGLEPKVKEVLLSPTGAPLAWVHWVHRTF